MNLSLALAQLQVKKGDFQHNTGRALEMIRSAADAKADMILFPEMWTGGFDYSDCASYAKANRRFLKELQKTADELNLAVGGSYLLEDERRVFNQYVLIQPGQPSLSYRKIHLFRLMEEDLHFSPGGRVSYFDTRWGPLSLAVCYDLRFPEMFLRMREKGSVLVIMAAGWPEKRIEHWQTLLRARAIENQCFFSAVNCVGGNAAAPFGGASAVIGPWGETVVEAGSRDEEMIMTTIDLDQARAVREKYPFFQDRLRRYSF